MVQQEVVNIEATSTPKEKITFNNKADVSTDAYQNGTFPGIVKKVNLDKDGSLIVSVDFIQIFGGKEAFLALIEDYNLGKNKSGNWDAFKTMYPTFKQLKSAVISMSDEQFETFFYNVDTAERQKNGGVVPSGALGDFPNGFAYERNESNKVRTFKIDKNVKEITISNSDKVLPIASLDKVEGIKEFTLKDGVITAVRHIYRP
jgi:hypothetical protein